MPGYQGGYRSAIAGCSVCQTCGVDENPFFNTGCIKEEELAFRYQPENPSDPCKSGGTITCPSDENLTIKIKADRNIVQFIDYSVQHIGGDGLCYNEAYCIFEPAYGYVQSSVRGGINDAIVVKTTYPSEDCPPPPDIGTEAVCVGGVDITSITEECT